jgi:hypothetical protein
MHSHNFCYYYGAQNTTQFLLKLRMIIQDMYSWNNFIILEIQKYNF